jgi:hypothetical protein
LACIGDLERQLERVINNLDAKDRQLQDAQANVAVLQNKLEAGPTIQAEADEKIANLTVSIEIMPWLVY